MHATHSADASHTDAGEPRSHAERVEIDRARSLSTTVVTTMTFAAARGEVWRTLLYYEQIEERPPVHLRWLLPVPLGTEGRKSVVGDEARCLYDGGYLIKRITHVDEGSCYGFEISEQALRFGGGLRLLGGEYRLRPHASGGTSVSLTTRYFGGRRPRWLFTKVEATVCHAFHRHILRAMRRTAESR